MRFLPILAAVALSLIPLSAAAQRGARLSPFTDVEVVGDGAVVVYERKKYELVSVEGLPTAQMLAWCRANEPRRWEDRFCTDLAEVLAGMGKKVQQTARLELRDRATNEVIVVERAPMTQENRTAVYDALERRRRLTRQDPVKRMTKGQMLEALTAFEAAMEERWSYLPVRPFDHKAMIETVRGKVEGGIDGPAFVRELQKVIGSGMDGHAQVEDWERSTPPGYLPFLVTGCGERFVAFRADRSGFVEEKFPFLEAIDGRGVPEWLAAASSYVPDGSPQYVRDRGLRLLRSVQFLREEMGIELKPTLSATLVSADGAMRKTVELPMGANPPFYGVWPPEDREPALPEGIAYVRLWDMVPDPAARTLVHTAMSVARQSGAKGLILDARDNGGGDRAVLRHLVPLLLRPGDRPRVVNAAVYRLHPEHTARMMESRYLCPENSPEWNKAEREAIAEFQKQFRPEWAPPADQFSAWHYMVLSPAPANVKRFDGKVAVLMNGRCFSATDLFLSGVKGLANVRLYGTPSGGGSANINEARLGSGPLVVRLGTMVSFQADGKLFDGRGVEPDVPVEPAAEFFTGGKDAPLEAAVKWIAGP